jgi:hypothetical protein
MRKIKTTWMALMGAAVLTACGGGGSDGEGTDARTKYVGTWLAECSIAFLLPGAVPRYETEQISIRLQGDTSLALTSTEFFYLDAACTQPATGEGGDTFESTLTFVGSNKTLSDGKVVDKVRAAFPDSAPNTTTPAILYTADNKMYVQFNDPEEEPVPVDSEGFPDALNLSNSFTKVSN